MADEGKSAEEKQQKVPKVKDVYLNRVFGNILDESVNNSYNLKLYMIKDRTSDGGGYINGAKAAKPIETVVIAQTGVTGVQMDGLTLDFVKDKQGHFAYAANFTLIQPGAADLLDQIQAAKVHLGIEAGMYANVPMFLEINFKGYESSLEEEDGGGAPIDVCGPYIYKLEIAKVSISIDDRGSEYEFMCTVGNSSAYIDNHFRIPMDTSVQGSTITEVCKELEDNINRFREENLTDNAVQDEFRLDIDQMVQALGDETIVYDKASRKAAEQVNRLMNAESLGITTKEEYEKALEENPDSLDGGASVNAGLFQNDRINFKEGTDINRFFTTILVMNKKFLESVSRKINFEDPDFSEANLDLKQTYTKWYKMEAEMEYLDYDTNRNKYAQRVTYQAMIYDTANENQIVSANETELDKEAVNSRIQELNEKNLLKAYHYLYTGLNDQILSADIKFDAGQVLLLAPGGGTMGDMSTNPNSNSPIAEESGDNKAASQKAEVEAKQLDTSKISEALKNDDGLRQRLKDKGIATDEELKKMDTDEKLRGAFAKTAVYLANQGKDPLGFKDDLVGNEAKDSSPTESDNQRNTGGGGKVYKPEPSGFLYAADILDEAGGMENVIGDNQALSELRKTANGPNKEPEATDPKVKTESSKSIVNEGSATFDGTSATLFGYMYNNVNDAAILVNMDIGLKGDPWYLGLPTTLEEARKGKKPTSSTDKAEQSKPEGLIYDYDDNYFLFTMQTPRVRDPDIEDEDNNTGYMDRAGTSYFISGIYMITKVSAVFNGGMFTCDVSSVKQTSLSLAKFDMTRDMNEFNKDTGEIDARLEDIKAAEEAQNKEIDNKTPMDGTQVAREGKNIPEGTTTTTVTNPDGSQTTTTTTRQRTYIGRQIGNNPVRPTQGEPVAGEPEDGF